MSWSLLLLFAGAAWGRVSPFLLLGGAVWPARCWGEVAFLRSPWVVLLPRPPEFRVELWVVLVCVFCVYGGEKGKEVVVGWLVGVSVRMVWEREMGGYSF